MLTGYPEENNTPGYDLRKTNISPVDEIIPGIKKKNNTRKNNNPKEIITPKMKTNRENNNIQLKNESRK